MNFFEKILGDKKPGGNSEAKPIDDIVTDEAAPISETAEQINSTHDFRLALADGRLAEAEQYLLKQKENPSHSGHDDRWLNNNLLILLNYYRRQGLNGDADRIKNMLPEDLQHTLEKNN